MKTIEEKATAYDGALEKAREVYNRGYYVIGDLETIFPELKESKDEKIRELLIRFHKGTIDIDGIKGDEIVSWLEKQVPIDEEKLSIGARKDVASSIITYLDRNTLGMCLSNMECEDLVNAVVDSDWSKVYDYMKKKLEKQGDKPQGKTAIEAIKEEKIDNANKVGPKFKVKYACCEYNVVEEKDIDGVTFYGIEDEPNHIDYVQAENCEIISGYAIKENGSPYPTKPAVFSEQNHTDKIKPKFHVGDWIVNNGHSYLIATIEDDRYLFEIGGYTHEQLNWEYIKNADKKYHLWTIQDAKPGDVLNANGASFIYKKYDKDRVYSYCGINLADEFIKADDIDTWVNNSKVYPATKEQCDYLFKKMHEAGYEWDAEKKELKKIIN